MRQSATRDAEFLEFLNLFRTNDYTTSDDPFAVNYITNRCKRDEQATQEALRRISYNNATRTIERITRGVYRTRYTRPQFPIKIAFASTTQKVQSMSIASGVAVSIAQPFKFPGQFYVACSRVTDSRNLYFLGGHLKKVKGVSNKKDITNFIRNFER